MTLEKLHLICTFIFLTPAFILIPVIFIGLACEYSNSKIKNWQQRVKNGEISPAEINKLSKIKKPKNIEKKND